MDPSLTVLLRELNTLPNLVDRLLRQLPRPHLLQIQRQVTHSLARGLFLLQSVVRPMAASSAEELGIQLAPAHRSPRPHQVYHIVELFSLQLTHLLPGSGFTLTSSKGKCAVSNNVLTCSSSVTAATVFTSVGGKLAYNGSTNFYSGSVPTGSTQASVSVTKQATALTIGWTSS